MFKVFTIVLGLSLMPLVFAQDNPFDPKSVGCEDGSADQVFGGADNMVGCHGMARDQESAEWLCGQGWRLCSVDEWVKRKTKTDVPTFHMWTGSELLFDKSETLGSGRCIVRKMNFMMKVKRKYSKCGNPLTKVGEQSARICASAYQDVMGNTCGLLRNCGLARKLKLKDRMLSRGSKFHNDFIGGCRRDGKMELAGALCCK